MGGIILLLVLAIWFYIAKKLSGFCVVKMETGPKKNITVVSLFLLFFLAPVADEIVGAFQFRALCTRDNILGYDPEKLKGKTIQYKDMPNYSINNKAIPIRVTHSQWADPETGEILITHKIFYAKAGWLSRLVGLSHSRNCDLKEYYELFEKLDIKELKGKYGE